MKGYKKFQNPYDKLAYNKICTEYKVNPKSIWINGDWPYTAVNAIFSTATLYGKSQHVKQTKVAPTRNYCQYMLKESKGLTNLLKIDESVRMYVYLILSTQISAQELLWIVLKANKFF